MRKVIIYMLLLVVPLIGISQDKPQKKKSIKIMNMLGIGIVYSGFTYEISHHFFKDYPKSNFHTTNDSKTWQGMDKLFHCYGSYQLNSIFYNSHLISGIDSNKALNLALAESFLFSTTKEIIDGYIKIAGWSWYDIAFNSIGNLSFYLQEKHWNQQKIQFKYSYFSSGLQHYNPSVLGNSYKNYWLRDYNGQTYWLSSSIGAWDLSSNNWLKPIAFSLGYGAHNMLNEYDNIKITNDPIEPYRQLYLGLDINFSQIPTKNKILKTIFFVLDRYRLPLPNIEFNKTNHLKFNLLGTK